MANFSSYVGEFFVCDIGWEPGQMISKQPHWNILTPWNTYFQREIRNTVGFVFPPLWGKENIFSFSSFKKQLKSCPACFLSSIISLMAETILNSTLLCSRKNITDFIVQVYSWFSLHSGQGRNLKNFMPRWIIMKVENLAHCLLRFLILNRKSNMQLCQNMIAIPIMFSIANLKAWIFKCRSTLATAGCHVDWVEIAKTQIL